MHLARTIPSLLSAARLVLAVPIGRLILDHQWPDTLAITLFAGLTDAADGWIARRWNLITRIGAWMDPIGDKVLLSTLYICLAVAGVVPVWLVWLVFGRDVCILLMAGYALAFTPLRDFPPSIWGKISTIVQGLTVFIALVGQVWPSPVLDTVFRVLVIAAAVATAVSGLHYGWSALQRMQRLRASGS